MTLHDDIRRMQERIDQLERELARHEERTEGMSARETFNRSKQYIDLNPEVWERIKADAAKAVMLGERFSIADEFEQLRKDRWLQRHEDEAYKCNNSYRACLTRFLLVEFPSLKVSVRKSKVDKYFPELKEVLEAA